MKKLFDLSSFVVVTDAHLQVVKGTSSFHPRSLLLEHFIQGPFLVGTSCITGLILAILSMTQIV